MKDQIVKSISNLGLTIDGGRDQSYDGTDNMGGRYVGASTLTKRQFTKAVYVPCTNNRLNLCVANTCSLPMVRNVMRTARKLTEILCNSPKSQHHLPEKIKELLPNSNHISLIDVCRTRRTVRLDGLDRVAQLIHPVLAILKDYQVIINKSEDGVVGAGNWNMKSGDDTQTNKFQLL